MGTRGLQKAAVASFVVALALLLAGGFYAKDKVPPIPDQILTGDTVIATRADIISGQDVYQRTGLMDHGSIWGHGSLRGPDFSAATLHRIGQAMRDFYAADHKSIPGMYEKLTLKEQVALDGQVIEEIHTNRYDPQTNILILTPAQTYAFNQIRNHWDKQLGEGNPRYGLLPDTVSDAEERNQIATFFFWTAWAAGTDRPDKDFTYTNNWPPDKSVGNQASAQAFIWSIASILALFIVLGFIIYIVHRYQFFYGEAKAVDASQRLLDMPVSKSQRASAKFFLLSGLLFLVQIFNGGLLAHYTVHPGSFYVKFIGDVYPYAWAKTWHLQLAILWIVVSWVGTAIYLAPMIARREPKGQSILVNILFAAIMIVGVGSLIGEVLGIKNMLGEAWFWLGHQGWEYLELGRLWQILLFVGLIYWLVIVYRALIPALKPGGQEPERRSLVLFYVASAVFVVAFFGFGLMYSRGTHLTIADYWRWFVVHIWVESIFEFFGVAVIALFLVTLGLVTAKSALRVAYLTAILVFLAGIPGTAHHYFWYGGPSFWLALGGVFSSLEPVPLILLVTRAWMEYRHIRSAGNTYPYRWPLYFLTASSAWNFLGAGVFGFMINLPIINYYEHATYLTSNHAHTALFGVYGMLAIALILFSWRGLVEDKYWKDGILKLSFYGLILGLFLMFAATLLPVGLIQTWYSYSVGFWYARSADFYELPVVQTLGNWRLVPDLIIIVVGALPLLYFLLTTFPKLRKIGRTE